LEELKDKDLEKKDEKEDEKDKKKDDDFPSLLVIKCARCSREIIVSWKELWRQITSSGVCFFDFGFCMATCLGT